MGKYSEEEIRSMKKITCKIAGGYLGISSMAVSAGMQNDLLPIGFVSFSFIISSANMIMLCSVIQVLIAIT